MTFEDALKGSEVFRLMIEALPSVMIVVEPSGRIVFVNSRSESLFAYRADELVGQSIDRILPERFRGSDLEHNADRLQHLKRLAAKNAGELFGLRKNGEEVPVIFEVNPLVVSGQTYELISVTGLVGRTLPHDPEESNLLHARMAAIVESSIAAIIGKDLQGLVTSWNKAAEQIFGYTAQEMIGQPIKRLLPPDRRQEEDDIMSKIARGVRVEQFETVRIHKDGRQVHVSIAVSPIMDSRGRVVGASKIAKDITERVNAAQSLRDAENHRLMIIENLEEGLIISDPDGKLVHWNPAAFRMHGFTSADDCNQYLPRFAEVFELRAADGEKIELDMWPVSRVIRGETLRGEEVRIHRRDQKWDRVFSYSGTLVHDASGKQTAFVTIQDVTEQRQSERRFRLVVEASPSAIIMVNEKGLISLVNSQTEKLFGYPREELVGQRIEVLVPEHLRGQHTGHRAGFFANPQARSMGAGRDLFGLKKDGSEVPIEIGLNPITTDEGMFVLASIIDITERKQVERALKTQAEDLFRSNKDLEQFAYVASHDLQEPLRAVAGCLQILERRYKGKLEGKADELIGHAVGGAYRMQALIEGLLEFSRVGTRGSEFRPVSVDASIDGAMQNLATAIRDAGAVITRDKMPTLEADPLQLTMLFQNLLANAIKFRGKMTPQIHIGAEHKEDRWAITVRDNGIGIDRQYFDRIFVIFQRLHTRDEYPGTGIGLAICKKIVERHGGSISIDSAPGEGATLTCSFADRHADPAR